jgi:hypothetical protein
MTKKADEPRITMRVPLSFRDMIFREAKELGIEPTVYLEGKKVVPL